MTVHDSVLDAIGGTPLIRLRRLTAGLHPRVFVKLEALSVGGSVKDRAALAMVRAALADGSLQPGGTIVEGTSGNTGIGLALVAAHLGHPIVIFTSSAVSPDKIRLLEAYGADVRLVDAFVPRTHPDSLASRVEAFVAETPGAWRANQYDNPANPEAHVATTGPEIIADLGHDVTHLVSTVGTGGTITGTGEYLKSVLGDRVRVIGADPFHSVYSGGDGAPKLIEGAGHLLHPDADEDVWPLAFRHAIVDEYAPISDAESIAVTRRAAREEGLLIGGSAGTALAAALRLAERLDESHTIVVLAPDSGRSYLSSYFDDAWLTARGFATDDSSTPDEESRAPYLPFAAVARSASVADALAAADAAGTQHILAVYDARSGSATLAPIEATGWTTVERLNAALDDGSATPEHTLGDVVAPPLPTAGRRQDLAAALADAAERPVPAAAVAVLENGRIVGVVDGSVAGRVAGTHARDRTAGDRTAGSGTDPSTGDPTAGSSDGSGAAAATSEVPDSSAGSSADSAADPAVDAARDSEAVPA